MAWWISANCSCPDSSPSCCDLFGVSKENRHSVMALSEMENKCYSFSRGPYLDRKI
jgi:hypothetical protein